MHFDVRFSLVLRCSLALLLIVSITSCRGVRKKSIMSQKKFVDVLVDIHIADGIAINNLEGTETFSLDSASLYASVFNKHKITRAQFDSTMHYYATRPEDFTRLYNKVIARVKMMEEALNEPKIILPSGKEELIWQDSHVHSLPQMGKNDRVEINVPVQGLGEYVVSAKIKLYKDDASVNPRMTLYYYYDNKSPQGYHDYFKEVKLAKDENQNTYTVSKRLTDAKVTHIKGFIVDHSNSDTLFKKHLVVSEVKVTKREQ